jgi:hypothetical protein
MENTGYNDYDALNLSLEKRYDNNWAGRISYSLSKSFGTGENQADKNTYQKLTDMNIALWEGPSSVDRRHNIKFNGRVEIPRTHGVNVSGGLTYMSGAPFTLYDSSVDVDQNGENDPLPAGVYSGTATDSMKNVKYKGGRNGAVGPNSFQSNVRVGWHGKMRGANTLELYLDIFNITNRANFENPLTANSDRRIADTFLVLTNLAGGGGFPRQAQMGLRYSF